MTLTVTKFWTFVGYWPWTQQSDFVTSRLSLDTLGVQFHCSICLEFVACQSAKYPHSAGVQNLAQDFLLQTGLFHEPRQTISVTMDHVCIYI